MGELKYVQIGKEGYFKISDVDKIRPFFMSIVSDSNHWMFISSNGGLTAGRKNAEHSLFPYYSDDKITESIEITGSKTILHVHREGGSQIWEPFSDRYYGLHDISRNLYKNLYGNTIIFEEINHDLKLSFRYQWNSSNVYGFVRTSTLSNEGEEVSISVLDGIQNIIPYGVGSELQNRQSNLVDAYKRSELLEDSGLGIYALSAIIVDRAEPSEALKANIAWSLGLEKPACLVSSLQLNKFRQGKSITGEKDVKAEKGAYFVNKDLVLNAKDEKSWMILANVNQDQTAIAEIAQAIRSDAQLAAKIAKDIAKGTERLVSLTAASDGIQLTADHLKDTRHFANTLFNIMRGGIFDDNYTIERWDLETYLLNANSNIYSEFEKDISALPEKFSITDLIDLAAKTDDPDIKRLSQEYLPLKFSRRHGDPSRPWNVFSINTRSEIDGSKILDYEGNWRDIFQNWEALAHSYPGFIEGMIHKFLNATTFDGYNPYRVTKGGFDWETVEPDNPWAYIGYWGDHQIIYLLKFLEFAEDHTPGQLESFFNQEIFVYANVPYQIKPYPDLLQDPKDTIVFDESLDHTIRQKRDELGADGALMESKQHSIYRVNFIEKLLATVLAKLSNFIPEGGIWMNTQRPEWNDANNALVGNGVSMVTLYYLRRFLDFMNTLLANSKSEEYLISVELITFFEGINQAFQSHSAILDSSINDRDRKTVVDGLGNAASDFRSRIYEEGFSGDKRSITREEILECVGLGLQYCEHSIEANKRNDNLYHAYNLMTVENQDEISISYLSEMLEGQVAILSSGYLSPEESLKVLDALKGSALFREDQFSYVLYPNKALPRFMEKNNIPAESVKSSSLLSTLIREGNTQIIDKDIDGKFHFNGNFKNANDLSVALKALPNTEMFPMSDDDIEGVLQIFEDVFDHKAFTGRSGTFFGYEGLGSIYWHMVSKLLLAVYETCWRAIESKADEVTIGKLLEHYYEINEGIGVHKSPELYGAFPTDPYSHTPQGKGAQQPGMTGQVKEDILSRYGELGIYVHDGFLGFNPCLLRKEEFLTKDEIFEYVDLNGKSTQLKIEAGSLCFTYCQVPVIFTLDESESLEIMYQDGESVRAESLRLDLENSRKIFGRTGEIKQIKAHIDKAVLN
ncbi:MAG: hypothetical protein KJO04_02630 [Bacteroidia bacterium]|nr:hypothetical protein [Bacteroidia bacterium]